MTETIRYIIDIETSPRGEIQGFRIESPVLNNKQFEVIVESFPGDPHTFFLTRIKLVEIT